MVSIEPHRSKDESRPRSSDEESYDSQGDGKASERGVRRERRGKSNTGNVGEEKKKTVRPGTGVVGDGGRED